MFDVGAVLRLGGEVEHGCHLLLVVGVDVFVDAVAGELYLRGTHAEHRGTHAECRGTHVLNTWKIVAEH